jgi:hypothetical protein
MDSDTTVFNKLLSGWGLAGSIAVAVTIKSHSRIYVLTQREGKWDVRTLIYRVIFS